eukprot:Filipodium_phascolosomae@DN5131_c0_g1_i1.p2
MIKKVITKFGNVAKFSQFVVTKRNIVTEISSVDDFSSLMKGEKPVLVQYSASWCGPCGMIKPHVLQLSEKYSQVEFVRVDVDTMNELAVDISSVPTFRLFKNSKVVAQSTGANPDSIESLIRNNV